MRPRDIDRASVGGVVEMNIGKLKDDLKCLDGKPPYDGPENISRNDAYFVKYMEHEYGKPLEELRKIARSSL